MACVVIYPSPLNPKPGRSPWHLVKGQLDGKPCQWHVTLWYRVPEEALDADEMNPRKMTLKSQKPMWLKDLIAGIIDPELEAEALTIRQKVTDGEITNIRWQAVQER